MKRFFDKRSILFNFIYETLLKEELDKTQVTEFFQSVIADTTYNFILPSALNNFKTDAHI